MDPRAGLDGSEKSRPHSDSILRTFISATVYVRISYDSHNKQTLFSYTELTGWKHAIFCVTDCLNLYMNVNIS